MSVPKAATTRLRARPWLDWVMPAWWVLLGLGTLLVLWVPSLSFAVADPPRAAALATFMVLVAAMVAFVGLARYALERRPFDLAIAVAFAAFALTRLWFVLAPLLFDLTPADLDLAPFYGWLVVRLAAGLLLLLALTRRGRTWIARAGFRLLGVLLISLGLDVMLLLGHLPLPRLLEPSVSSTLAAAGDGKLPLILPGLAWPVAVVQVGLCLLYATIARRLARRRSKPAEIWLPLALSTAAVAELHFAAYPTPFDVAITTSAELLWLLAYALLAIYLGHQYLQGALALRQQQVHSAALLQLSQTRVAERDRGQVFAAVACALRTVRAPGQLALHVRHDLAGGAVPSSDAFARHYPIAEEDTVYGWITVPLRGGEEVPVEVEEYLTIVANQAASLLRAIDLYAELTEAAIREERMQLARELHDGLAQDLAVLRFELEETDLVDQQRSITRALAEARYLVTVLHGEDATPTDFLAAFARQAEELADRIECPIIVESQGVLRAIPPPMQVALLRIAREAMINAGKHASASRITACLTQRGEQLQLEIHDDGQGFNTAAPLPQDRYGLRSIGARVAALGGRWEIVSQPGAGTVVRITVPCAEAEVERCCASCW